jgi:LysM repeat protein
MGLFGDKKGAPVAEPAGQDQLVQLRHKYDPAIKLMHELGVQLQNVEMQGGKLLVRGVAPSEQAKNRVWDEIKKIDPSYADLTADLKVTAAGAGQGGPSGAPSAPMQTYTVQSGDTLSKISQHFYGRASDYKRIFEANRDQLTDPDKIQPGQVLRIPR